jgi:hypothetical protein
MIPDDIVVLEPTARKKGSNGQRASKPVIGSEEEQYILETFEKNGWPQKIHFTNEQFWALLDKCPDGKTPLSEKPDEEPEGGWDEGKYGWVGLWQKAKKKELWWRPNKGVHVDDDGKETILRGFSVAQLKDDEEPRYDQAKARLEELRTKVTSDQETTDTESEEPVAETETVEAETEKIEAPKTPRKRAPRKSKK